MVHSSLVISLSEQELVAVSSAYVNKKAVQMKYLKVLGTCEI